MFRRGMRRLIDWFLLVTVIFMKLYYAKEAWGELFVGPLGVPTLREAGRPSNWSFWSRDSWKHIGFQLSSAFDAGWQPQVSSFCPGLVCSHHPHRERYLGSLGQSTLKWGPRVALEQVLYLHWTDGPLLWCHLCFSPQLGPLQLQFMKQTLHIGCIMPGVRNSLVSTRRLMVEKVFLSTWYLEKGQMQPTTHFLLAEVWWPLRLAPPAGRAPWWGLWWHRWEPPGGVVQGALHMDDGLVLQGPRDFVASKLHLWGLQ